MFACSHRFAFHLIGPTILFAVLPSCGGSDGGGKPDAGSLQCDRSETECGNGCAELSSDPDNCGACGVACNASEVCSNGSCALSCQSGLTDCTRSCVNLRTDPNNCGGCDNECPVGQVCSNGTCAMFCEAHLTDCSGACANTSKDPFHCGDCDTACPQGQVCSNGACAVSCQQGLTECDGTCENLQTSPDNCGDCGVACPSGEVCSEGACAPACQPHLATCDGLCVNRNTDNEHCGACYSPCASGTLCSMGTCSVSCQTGQTECEGICIDPQTSLNHCGASVPCATNPGEKCAPGEVCNGGTCGLSCGGATPDLCGNACVDTQTDPDHCGAGCVQCAAGGVCKAGVCGCPSGEEDCAGTCVNTSTDLNQCGACAGDPQSDVCGAGEKCVNGVCQADCQPPDVSCSGTCTNTAIDPKNCSTCGNECPTPAHALPVCESSNCDFVCQGGWEDCDLQPTNGCEVDGASFPTNPLHCGACNQACPTHPNTDATCTSSSCGSVCSAGWADCNTSLVDGCEIATSSFMNNPLHCGGCNQACGAGQSCAGGKCGKRVFVTSTTHTGALGGLVGADAICAARASAAGLGGTWMAWLSTSGSSPSNRFSTHFSGQYIDMNGNVIANSWADLVDGTLVNAIHFTESGLDAPEVAGNTYTWTGTTPSGTASNSDCTGWTSSGSDQGTWGYWSITNDFWTQGGLVACFSTLRLYCFEQ